MDKKQRQFDRLISDWKQKCADLTSELAASQTQAKGYSIEIFKLRGQVEESSMCLEGSRLENCKFVEEIRDFIWCRNSIYYYCDSNRYYCDTNR
jgi:hypothetical protein